MWSAGSKADGQSPVQPEDQQLGDAFALPIVINIGLVGLGKIARDEHLPAIAKHSSLNLVAVASRNAHCDGVSHYPDLAAMLAADPAIDAVILCQPPQVRFEAAVMALEAGKHVFLEKPPGITVAEVETLIDLARERGVTLYASWHSRFGSAIPAARAWLKGKSVRTISVVWKEDVRHWHPGQDWIWQEGGFGVFDPGINALSILTTLINEPITLRDASLEVASNHAMPIAARLAMTTASRISISADFDFRQTGPQAWDIVIETDTQTARLSGGGNALSIDETEQVLPQRREYPDMYAHFARLVEARAIDVDLAPLEIVERALALAVRHQMAAFQW